MKLKEENKFWSKIARDLNLGISISLHQKRKTKYSENFALVLGKFEQKNHNFSYICILHIYIYISKLSIEQFFK